MPGANHIEEEEEYGDEVGQGVNPATAVAEGAEKEEKESRALTHEEIWDDSALIDAWNSAAAEYEAYHGTSKTWKTGLAKKSPLWYNKPCTAPLPQPGPSKPKPREEYILKPQESGGTEHDTAPLDFDSYVPTHDPSLGVLSQETAANSATNVPLFDPSPSAVMVGRDEAFDNALSAMYWSGYWTAVHHSQTSGKNNQQAETTENGINSADEVDEDLIPTR